MVEGQQRAAWNHTADLVITIAGVHGVKLDLDAVHPFMIKPKLQLSKEDSMSALKGAFVDG